MHDVQYGSLRDIEASSQCIQTHITGCVFGSDSAYGLIVKLGASMLNANRFGMLIVISAFCDLIVRVVFLRSEKEMVGINARWIVAAMTNDHPIRNWSFVDFIGKAMRSDYRFFSASV
jgi:hypothetical protein